MALLDFWLSYLQRQAAILPDARIHVLLQFKEKPLDLSDIEFRVTSTAGNIAAGTLPFKMLDQLREHPGVLFVEAAPSFKSEMNLSMAAIKLMDSTTKKPVIPGAGKGAIIGFIDSSFDLTHPCFLDLDNKTRILAAWDQTGRKGTPPAEPFAYGVEYTPEMINEHLKDDEPLLIKNEDEAGEHGTVVAGIAAGNGFPNGTLKGVAPEAQLIFVAHRNDVPIGGSAFVLDAISYIVGYARRLKKPVVINLSQGDNLGAHDGTSLLERAIDFFIEQGDVLIVNSAGNEREGRRHAEGKVFEGAVTSVLFRINPNVMGDVDGDTIDIWYRKGDRFAVALTTPGDWQSEFVQPDTEKMITFPNGTQAYVCSITNHPCNGDNRISIILEKSKDWEKQFGWELNLEGIEVMNGSFHAWTDRPNRVSHIDFPQAHATESCTITLPGTARHILSVGGFVARPMGTVAMGSIASFSSLGPTRDGRIKPEILAPGFNVKAPGNHQKVGHNLGGHTLQIGTSAAAPHVSGIIALIWALKPKLTSQQLSLILRLTAGADSLTGATPNANCGHGKLNAGLAYEALSILMKGELTVMSAEKNPAEQNSDESGSGKMQFSVLQPGATDPIPLSVIISVENGVMNIKANDGQDDYVGTIIFHLKDAGTGISPAGGDQCIVCDDDGKNCRVVTPCPKVGGQGG